MTFTESALVYIGVLLFFYVVVTYIVAMVTVHDLFDEDINTFKEYARATGFILFAPVTVPYMLISMRKEHEPQ